MMARMGSGENRKLNRGEYIDHWGNVRMHSDWYFERQKQIRRRLVAAGSVLAVLILGITLGITAAHRSAVVGGARTEGISEDREADQEETGQNAVEWNGEYGTVWEQTVVSPEAEEPAEPDIGADGQARVLGEPDGESVLPKTPDLFYPGYEVYRDGETEELTDEGVMSPRAVLIDLADGHIVMERDADARMYPASMTKVLTVLVAAELVRNLDDTFIITQEIADYVYRHDCTVAGYEVGEEVTIRELFYGTIVPSGADAALALAEYTCGSSEAFAERMNEKVAQLGLSESAHFTNPIGLHDEQNYCTSVAMAMIMKAALENDLCREVLSVHKYTTAPTPYHPEGIELSNWFLRRIEDKDTHGEVLGAKTGFVNESGSCAVSYERSADGGEYICVTGGAWSAWRAIYDHVAIYCDYVE